jgi:HK97 family phage major capsid protein
MADATLARLEELRHKRADELEAMQKLIDEAEAEHRDLNRQEKRVLESSEKRFDKLTEEIQTIEKRHGLGEIRFTRAVAADGQTPRDKDEGIALSREERVADWAEERFGSRSESISVEDRDDFSLGRLMRGMVTGEWSGAEAERRALSEGTDSAGGFLTPEVLGAEVIDRVRKRARVMEAGARTIPLESDQQAYARLATGVTGAWKAENAAVTESDPAFERVTFKAHTLAVLVKLSYELFDDLTEEGAQAIENELVQALSLELDRVALRGSGSGQEPTGIRNQSGVTIQSLGTNGVSPTYAALVNAVATIQEANLDPNASIYTPRTSKALGNLVDTTGQPLRPSPTIEGLTRLVSNQIPNNLTQGTANNASEIYTGQWDQLLIGIRPTVRIQNVGTRVGTPGFPVNLKKSSDAFMDTMSIALLAWIRADVQVAHPEAFVVSTGALP